MKFQKKDFLLTVLIAVALLSGTFYLLSSRAAEVGNLTIPAGTTYVLSQDVVCNNLILEGKLQFQGYNPITVNGSFTARGSEATLAFDGGGYMEVKGVLKGTAKLNIWPGFYMDSIVLSNDMSNNINLNVYVYSGDKVIDTRTVTRLRSSRNGGRSFEEWFTVSKDEAETPILIGALRYYNVKKAIMSENYSCWQVSGGNDREGPVSTGSKLDVYFQPGSTGGGYFYGGGRTTASGDTTLNVTGNVGGTRTSYFVGGGTFRPVLGKSLVNFNANVTSKNKAHIVGGTRASAGNLIGNNGDSEVTISSTGSGYTNDVMGGSIVYEDPLDFGPGYEEAYVDGGSATVTLKKGSVLRILGGGVIDASTGSSTNNTIRRLTLSKGVTVNVTGGTVRSVLCALGLITNDADLGAVTSSDKGTSILGTAGTVTVNVSSGDFNNRDIRAGGSYYGDVDPDGADLNYNTQLYAKNIVANITGGKNIRNVYGGATVWIGNNKASSKVSYHVSGDIDINISGSTVIANKIVGGTAVGTALYNDAAPNDYDKPVKLNGTVSSVIDGDVNVKLSDNVQVGSNYDNPRICLAGDIRNGDFLSGSTTPTNTVSGDAALTIKNSALSKFTGIIYGRADKSAIKGKASVVFDGWTAGEFKGDIVSVDKVTADDSSTVTFAKKISANLEIEKGSTVTLTKAADIDTVKLDGTLIISGDANTTVNIANMTLGDSAKVIVKGSSPTVNITNANGSVNAATFTVAEGSNAKLTVRSIGGKGITATALETYSLKKGDTVSLDKLLTITPKDAYNLLLKDTFVSDNTATAKVDKAIMSITGAAKGTANVSISANTGTGVKKLSTKITIIDPTVPISSDVSKDLPEGTVTGNTKAATEKEVSSDLKAVDILNKTGAVVANGAGVLKVSTGVSQEFIRAMAAKDSTINSSDITSLAIIIASYDVTSPDAPKTLVMSDKLVGADFPEKAVTFAKLKLVKLSKDGSGKVFTTVFDAASLTDGTFLIKDESGAIVSSADTIDRSKTYTMSVAVKDNGTYDLDGAVGTVVDPRFLTSTTDAPAPSGGGSGGGCNGGFAGLLLLAIAPLAYRKSKK